MWLREVMARWIQGLTGNKLVAGPGFLESMWSDSRAIPSFTAVEWVVQLFPSPAQGESGSAFAILPKGMLIT